MDVTVGFLVAGAQYRVTIPDAVAGNRELTGYYEYQGGVRSLCHRAPAPGGPPMGAGLTAAGTMVSAAGPITLFQQPAPPAFYVGYVPAGAGHLVTYADDAETLKDVFDHVTVQETGPFGAHVALEPPLRAGDIRVLTERDEVAFSGAVDGSAPVSSVRLVVEPARRAAQAEAIQTGLTGVGMAQASSPLGVRVFCEGGGDLAALQAAATSVAQTLSPA